MSWIKSFLNNPIGTVTDTATKLVTNPGGTLNDYWMSGGRDFAKLGALVGTGYLAAGALGVGAGAAGAGAAGAGAAGAGAAGAGAAGAGAAGAGLLSGSSWMTPAAILGSSLLGGYSANQAANVQSQAADRAAALQAYQFERQTELQEPWRRAGEQALNKLVPLSTEYTPFGTQQFEQDPGYAFRLAEGQKALERSAAARGGLISGGALKAAQRYGQEMGSQEYQNAFNRYQTERSARLNPLQTLAGVGQTAVNQLGAAGQQYASNAGEAIGAGAQARASGYMGAANVIGGGLNQYLNYQQGLQQNALLQQALGQNR